MTPAPPHPIGRRLAVVALFFAGLVGLAGLEVVIDRLSRSLRAGCTFDLWGLHPVVGGALALAGLGLVIWSVWVQYSQGRGTPAPLVATRQLVTTGPYALCRNPMTLGALIFYLGLGFSLGSGLVIALTGIIFTGLLRYIAVHETRELTERFGDDYRAYCRRTPFVIPRCRMFPSRHIDKNVD